MAGDTAEQSADAQLAELFAPVVALRSQSSECGEGEPYYPVPVDVLFGRDDVVIRDATGDVLVQGPTIDDLADLDADSWIDIPGDALRPGCDYEQWFDALEAPPTVYARVVHDPEASQPIVVQYWFFYTYNDWNDRHEGDWEMVQVGFDESTVEAAIGAGPSVYAFAQHEGAEVARRGDTKLTLVDETHPVVFPAAGSHATYFSSSRWFGKSAATGFGCDDTRAPLDEVRPAVVSAAQRTNRPPANSHGSRSPATGVNSSRRSTMGRPARRRRRISGTRHRGGSRRRADPPQSPSRSHPPVPRACSAR